MENTCTVFGPGAGTPSAMWLSRNGLTRALFLCAPALFQHLVLHLWNNTLLKEQNLFAAKRLHKVLWALEFFLERGPEK